MGMNQDMTVAMTMSPELRMVVSRAGQVIIDIDREHYEALPRRMQERVRATVDALTNIGDELEAAGIVIAHRGKDPRHFETGLDLMEYECEGVDRARERSLEGGGTCIAVRVAEPFTVKIGGIGSRRFDAGDWVALMDGHLVGFTNPQFQASLDKGTVSEVPC